MQNRESLFNEENNEAGNRRPVKCLGKTFSSDDARRAHFLALLAEKLKDPEFRKDRGIPDRF